MRHPLHPLFAHFPLALWVSSSLWDGLARGLGQPLWSQLAYWSLVASSVSAAPTLVTGFVELLRLPAGHPAETTVHRHLQAMGLAAVCFIASLLLRSVSAPGATTGPLAVGLGAVGVLALLVGGFWGAELVYRHGLGVEPEPPEG